LGWFDLHEQCQNVQDIEQFGRVLGQPVIGLNVAELGRGSPVANVGRSGFLLRCEPLRQHPLAAHFVPPDGGRDVLDEVEKVTFYIPK
jgi:hypothetical protein